MEEHRAKVKAYIKVTSWQYAWMLEYNGHRLYGEGEGSTHSVNRKLTAIEALADMLGHMNRGATIDLEINEMNVANYINSGWLGKWKQNNWKTVGGVGVKYAGIYVALNGYEVQERTTEIALISQERNEYLLKKFMIAKTVKGCTPRTLRYYRDTLKFVFDYIGKTVDDITSDDIRMYSIIRMKKDGVTEVTADNELRVLRSFYGYLQREEILTSNPMLKIECIRAQRVKKTAFTEMEIEKLRIQAMETGARESMIVETLLSTGMRVAELAQVRLCEIEGNRVLTHGKGKKDRYTYLNAKAELAMDRYLKIRNDDNPYLIPGRIMQKGDKELERPAAFNCHGHIERHQIEETLKGIAQAAGVAEGNPHKYRRTCATMALRRGMPVEQVSKMLGHEQLTTTQIYLDIDEENMKAAHRKYVV